MTPVLLFVLIICSLLLQVKILTVIRLGFIKSALKEMNVNILNCSYVLKYYLLNKISFEKDNHLYTIELYLYSDGGGFSILMNENIMDFNLEIERDINIAYIFSKNLQPEEFENKFRITSNNIVLLNKLLTYENKRNLMLFAVNYFLFSKNGKIKVHCIGLPKKRDWPKALAVSINMMEGLLQNLKQP